MANKNTKTTPINPTISKQHHFIRTALATLFGFLAVNLILASIFTVWLNRTLTDTPTFVNTVAPLIEKPEVQQFIAKNAAIGIVNNAKVDEIASQVLTPQQRAGKNAEELKNLAAGVIETKVQKVVSTPAFANTWKNAIESSHSAVVTQLDSDAPEIKFDLTPVIRQASDQLAKAELGLKPGELKIEDGMGAITIKRSDLGPATDAYNSLQNGTVALLIAALVSAVACVLLSVNHMKTLRRVLVFTGVFSLIFYGLLSAPSFVDSNGIDPVNEAAAKTIFSSVFADLRNSFLAVGILSIVVAIGTKIFQMIQKKKSASA